jgi:hypothetical protein
MLLQYIAEEWHHLTYHYISHPHKVQWSLSFFG